MKKNGFKTALVKKKNKYFILVVDKEKMYSFKNYINSEKYKVIQWLDNLK